MTRPGEYPPGMHPQMHGPNDPVHPCRRIPTRHCPVIYDGVCGDRPCARYESDDETPWLPELTRSRPQ